MTRPISILYCSGRCDVAPSISSPPPPPLRDDLPNLRCTTIIEGYTPQAARSIGHTASPVWPAHCATAPGGSLISKTSAIPCYNVNLDVHHLLMPPNPQPPLSPRKPRTSKQALLPNEAQTALRKTADTYIEDDSSNLIRPHVAAKSLTGACSCCCCPKAPASLSDLSILAFLTVLLVCIQKIIEGEQDKTALQ